MIKLLKYMKWWYWLFVLAMVGIVYQQVSFDLSIPEYIGNIIRYIGIGANTGISQTSEILHEGLKMLAVALGSISLTIIVGFIASRIGSGLSRNIREALYQQVDDFSMKEINEFSTASLITRSTNDITQVQMAVIFTLRMAITAPIMAIKGITKITGISDEMSLIVAIGIVLIMIMISVIFINVLPRFRKIQSLIDDLNLVTRENITGIRVIRAFNSEKYEEEKFNIVNSSLTKTNLEVNFAMAFMMPGMQLIMSAVNLAIIWLGAILINNLTLGANPMEGLALETQFVTYANMIIISFMMLIMLFIMIPRAQVSGKRINEVLQKFVTVKDNAITSPVKFTNSNDPIIEYSHVNFNYEGANENVLNDINLKIYPGETIAIVGSTGSGKSTMINLIPRFYDVSSGSLKIFGKDIRKYSQEDLHNLIGYVPQSGTLFSGTIRSNIKIGKDDATDDEILKALKISQAMEFINKLDDGLDAIISQGGKNFSGGQKQRLGIARAVVRQSKIYIFDDSFSALDYKIDKLLRKELTEQLPDATKFIVAQRIGTIINADKIIVLEKGKIACLGTHKELLKSCEVYKEIALSQLSEEEINHG
ncbi:MAG: ABC transporter ATP-binding protein [Candidatus Izimaplasma sp.]|nr:ABC transporter ATP-binding protein [Candidatus Izimaplasma bacterium]